MSLRQEYVKNKISLHEARKEEVKDWLNENVVFINERMDRARVKRLINLMLKFDQKFGPFKDKIPGITSIVADAENALQMALSGRLSNAKIGDIFQRLSIIYSILSDFFANDLKVLLQTPAFKVPRTKPEVRLDSITDSGYSPKHITDTLVLTLSPSEEEMVFLNKLYKGITLPQLDRHSIANQMLGLSYKDLEGLCGMEHVPMAVVPDENLLNEQIGQAIKNVLGGAAAGGAAGSVVPGIGTAVGAGVGAAAVAGKAIYDYFRSPQVQALKKTINDLQATTNKLQIPALSAALNGFRKRLNAAMDKKQPTKTDTLILSQAVIVAEFYKNLAETLKELTNDEDAKTLSQWSETQNETDRTVENIGKQGNDDVKAALETLTQYLDSTIEKLNPEGNLAKLKNMMAQKYKSLGTNFNNSLPEEFRTVFPNIRKEIINIILKESSTLRESHFAHKRKNNFINFNNDVNKILNEGLKDLTAIVNSLAGASTKVEQGGSAAAKSSTTSPQGGAGTAQPVDKNPKQPTTGNPAAIIDAAEARDQFLITPSLAGQALDSLKKLTSSETNQAKGSVAELNTAVKELGIAGNAGLSIQNAINSISKLANVPGIKNVLTNPDTANPEQLLALLGIIKDSFDKEKPMKEQIPQIVKLSNIVSAVNDLASRLPAENKPAPTPPVNPPQPQKE